MTEQTRTYRISVSTPRRKDFDAVVDMIKRTAGKYDPSTKTWTLTAEDGRDALAEMALYNHASPSGYADCMTIEEV